MHNHPFSARARVPALALAGALGLLALRVADARAAPPHDWRYPFCGAQPVITSVYDHEYPTYGCDPNGNSSCTGQNGVILLYNNTPTTRLGYEGHNGWDYATRTNGANTKRPVFAANGGKVTYVGWNYPESAGPSCDQQVANHERGYGLMIRISDGNEESLYGHLSAVHVLRADIVQPGQMIGSTGTTGNSTGPHLHFGAFRPKAPTIIQSFDPYGWNADWRGQWDLPLPRDQDPWDVYGGPGSVRRILPGAGDNGPCPATCGQPTIVDDGDPGFQLGCASGVSCPNWKRVSAGYNGDLEWTYPNGETPNYWARWTAPLPPGSYMVEAYVPLSRNYGTSHAARYRIAGRTIIADQHEEGGVWVHLGIHSFTGNPVVELSDASFITSNYAPVTGSCQTIAADAMRFTPICGPGGGLDAAAPASAPLQGAS